MYVLFRRLPIMSYAGPTPLCHVTHLHQNRSCKLPSEGQVVADYIIELDRYAMHETLGDCFGEYRTLNKCGIHCDHKRATLCGLPAT